MKSSKVFKYRVFGTNHWRSLKLLEAIPLPADPPEGNRIIQINTVEVLNGPSANKRS